MEKNSENCGTRRNERRVHSARRDPAATSNVDEWMGIGHFYTCSIYTSLLSSDFLNSKLEPPTTYVCIGDTAETMRCVLDAPAPSRWQSRLAK